MEGKTRKIRPNISVTPFDWKNRSVRLFVRYFYNQLMGVGNRYTETFVLIVFGFGIRIIHYGKHYR